MKTEHKQPAFPAFPAQDQFGSIVSPFPGFSKFEFVALEFAKKFLEMKGAMDQDTMYLAIESANIFLYEIDKQIEIETKREQTEAKIISINK